MSNSPRVTASPSAVRAWAREQGMQVGTRGKFSPDLIKAYNAANGVKYVEGQHVPTVRHSVKPAKGRTVTRTINPRDARAWAAAAGLTVGKRGRVPQEILDLYVLNLANAKGDNA